MTDTTDRPTRDKTLRKGLHLIETLTRSGPMHLRDLMEVTGLKKGNAYQLLQTLIEEGYVQTDGAGRYLVTIKLWEVGMQQYEHLDLVEPCLEAMRRLSADTRETVNLAQIDGTEVLYLHKIDSLEAVRSFTRVGGRAPAHCVATGKAILAFDPREEELWRSLKMDSFSATTITDVDAFVDEMRATRSRGYSINHGEWRGAVRGVAAPIFGWGDRVRLAIGIAGPGERLTAERIEEVATSVIAAADAASAALGGAAASDSS